MAKKSIKTNKSRDLLTLLTVVAVVLLIACIWLTVLAQHQSGRLARQADMLGKYELLEKIDNQACRYLTNQSTINGSFDLNVDVSVHQPKLTYKCLTGEQTTSREIQGKLIGAYDFGAIVHYFATQKEAIKFAEEKLNPLRYWGVSEDGPMNGIIPQTSHFTFIVNDEKIPYFDAYTVKANAVVRVSLPCGDSDVVSGGVACYAEADAALMRELKGINVL